ncbi:MAG: hypothetical protein MJA31_17525 [Clostridia bacterium]|nr:hypothetical protein [Clostridia bacterium]
MIEKIIFWGLLVLILYFAYRKAEKTVKALDQEDKRQSEAGDKQEEKGEEK